MALLFLGLEHGPRSPVFWRLPAERRILIQARHAMTDTARLTAALTDRYAIERELGAGVFLASHRLTG